MLFDKEMIKRQVLSALMEDPDYRKALAIALAPELKEELQNV